MTIRHLTVFAAVAEQGSMSAAAKHLYLSQPTVSQAIRELEAHYNGLLFERLGKKLYLTERGKLLLPHAREMIRQFQQLEELPAGYTVPEGRVKPWGTCHAVLAAKDLIDGPFAVINADDYYGPEAFRVMYDYLSTHEDGSYYDYCMVSYLLRNTVSENGSVARGVCVTNPDGTLHSVTERTRIEPYADGVHYTEDGGASWTDLPGDTPVSMNLWGFGKSFLDEAENRFAAWLDANLPTNPLKCEYFLPLVVTELIEEGKAKIQVLRSTDKWYGVTYREDKPLVVEAIARKTAEGQYPENLWA